MGKTAWMYKQKQEPKFPTRGYTRCQLCGRSHGVYRKYMLCRCCFRVMAHKGLLPGVRKASW